MHPNRVLLGDKLQHGEATCFGACIQLCQYRYSKPRLTVWLRVQVKRVAVLVSKMSHCLYDLLIRHRSGEAETKVCRAC